MKRSSLFYILLIAANVLLITGMVVYHPEGYTMKIYQVLIIIVTFTLFRSYIRERQQNRK